MESKKDKKEKPNQLEELADVGNFFLRNGKGNEFCDALGGLGGSYDWLPSVEEAAYSEIVNKYENKGYVAGGFVGGTLAIAGYCLAVSTYISSNSFESGDHPKWADYFFGYVGSGAIAGGAIGQYFGARFGEWVAKKKSFEKTEEGIKYNRKD